MPAASLCQAAARGPLLNAEWGRAHACMQMYLYLACMQWADIGEGMDSKRRLNARMLCPHRSPRAIHPSMARHCSPPLPTTGCGRHERPRATNAEGITSHARHALIYGRPMDAGGDLKAVHRWQSQGHSLRRITAATMARVPACGGGGESNLRAAARACVHARCARLQHLRRHHPPRPRGQQLAGGPRLHGRKLAVR